MFGKIRKKITYACKLIQSGKIKDVFQALVRRLKSEEIAYGFKRDLNINFAKPRSLVKVSIRVYQPHDGQYFTERKNDGLINEFHTCYVGIT